MINGHQPPNGGFTLLSFLRHVGGRAIPPSLKYYRNEEKDFGINFEERKN